MLVGFKLLGCMGAHEFRLVLSYRVIMMRCRLVNKKAGQSDSLRCGADCVLTLEVCADMAPSPHSPVCTST